MANLINSVNNGYTVANAGLKQEDVQATLSKSKQVATDSFESNSAVKTMSGAASAEGVNNTLRYLPAIWLADKALEKSISKTGSKGLLSKAAKLGDKISDSFHLEKFLSTEKTGRISNFLKNNRFTKYFTNDYKAIPKSSMAKSRNLAQELAEQMPSEVTSGLKALKHNYNFANELSKGAVSLSDDAMKALSKLGNLNVPVSEGYLTSVSNTLKEILPKLTDSKEQQIVTVLKKSIDDFLSNQAVITNSKKISTQELSEAISGIITALKQSHPEFSTTGLSAEANKVLNSVISNADDVIATMPKEKVSALADELISKGLSSDKLSGLKNKLNASELKTGNTLLGKLFAKGTLKTKNTLTFGGGLISLFFTASAIAQAVKATKEAPKGEKKATFMHVMSEQYLGMILFQPSINLVYKAAGNKYRGMSVGGRKALADLISKTNADETLTKEALKVAKMQRKLLLKGVDETKVADLAGKGIKEAKTIAKSLKGEGTKLRFWEKPLKAVGTLLGTGLDKMQIPKFVNIKGKKIKIPHPTLKGFAGGLARFALIMFVVQPLIQKPLTKLCHKIFGEPKTYLAKQKAGEESKNGMQQQMQNTTSATSQNSNGAKPTSTNLLDQWRNVQNQTANVHSNALPASQIAQNEQEAIPAKKIADNKKSERYIPSIEVSFADDSSALDKRAEAILKSTESVMASAGKLL